MSQNKPTYSELREQTNLSQSQFAKRFFIPTRTFQKWEYYEDGKTEQGRKPPEYVKKLILQIIALEREIKMLRKGESNEN